MNKNVIVSSSKPVLLFFVGLFTCHGAVSGNIATQTVTTSITAVNEISMGSAPTALTIDTIGQSGAGGGLQSESVTSSYNFTTNDNASDKTKKITASLGTAVPANVTLNIHMAPPGGNGEPVNSGSGADFTSDTSGAVNLVTGITPVASSDNTITYTLSAEVTAGVITYSPVVTYTISDT